jgi:ferric-dicitrate binding protein FerR (iron transport regulator)
MTSVRGLTIALCSLLLTVANGPAMGAAPIGRIVATLGEVHLLRQGEELSATAGAAVFAADRLVTRARARVRIALSDGSTLAMGADTALDLARYERTETGVLSGLIRLLNGILRTRIDSPGAQIRIQTRTAVASVRSTQWMMDAEPDNTAVFVSNGVVTVSGRTGAPVNLGPGEGTDVAFNSAASPPRTWGATRVDAFRERIDF